MKKQKPPLVAQPLVRQNSSVFPLLPAPLFMNSSSPESSDLEDESAWLGVSKTLQFSLEQRFGLKPPGIYCQDWDLEVHVPCQKLPEIVAFYEQPFTTEDERLACVALLLSTIDGLMCSTSRNDQTNQHWLDEVWPAVAAIVHRDQGLLKPVIDCWASWSAENEDEEHVISPMLRKAVKGSQKSNHPS